MTAAAGRTASLLAVFPWCLDRVGHGNIQRMLAIVRHVAATGTAVDFVYQGNPGVPSREGDLHWCRRVVRVDAWRSSDDAAIQRELEEFYEGFELPPANLWPGTALTRIVRGLHDALDYDAVLSCYAWTAPIFAPLARRALRVVDVQDVISLHAARAREAVGAHTPFSMRDDTERFLWRQWDVLLAITPEEARLIEPALRPAQRLIVVPHAASITDTSAPAGAPVLYTGSDNPSNRVAVKWLLEQVWPRVRAARPGAVLRLVGLIGEVVHGQPAASGSGVEVAGFVEDVGREVAGAAVVVAPYLYGSGLKVKVIEAAAAGRAVVTTAVGAEGTGLLDGEHLRVASTPEAFAAAIVELLADPAGRQAMEQRAQALVGERFSAQSCYGPVVRVLADRAADTVRPGGVPSVAIDRVRAAHEALGGPRLVVWGNGAHTRALAPMLAESGFAPRGIVDKSALGPGVSPEGLPVAPPSSASADPDQLIVLSSQLFEPDMWQDLAPWRDRGAHVLALYRRDLVTPALAARLREREAPAPRRGHGGLMTAGRGARLVLVEPSAGRSRGPFLRLALALASAAAPLGLHVLVAGARRTTLEGLDPEEQALLVPAFEHAHWDCLGEVVGDTWRAVARYGRLLADDLEGLGARLQLRADDLVLMHTANLVEVTAVTTWLARRRAGESLEVRLLFHFLPEQESRWLKIPPDEARHAYRVLLAQLEERCGARLRLLAQSDALAKCLELAFDRPVAAMGFPVRPRPSTPAAAHEEGPARLLYGGEARADKGFTSLPLLADALREELESGRLRLVCQAMPNEFADERLREAACDLAARSGVEVIDRFLASAAYDALVASADLMVLPYQPNDYRMRLSAVLVDAACAGTPVVVPAGTWLSQQIEAGRAAGECFRSLETADLAAAVRRALDRLPALRREAACAAPAAQAAHDPAAVLATILARASAAP